MSEVMIGIIDPDGYEKVNRVYSTKGECPTLQARDFKDPIKILDIEKVSNTIGRAEQNRCMIIGQMDNTVDHTFESANRVYDIKGIAPTIPTCAGGNIQPKVLTRI